jgi:5-methylcytosine-specific restriction endonuclease McrA
VTRHEKLKEWKKEEGFCENCGLSRQESWRSYKQDLQIHHKHYRTYGNEDRDDVEVLCRRCHIETEMGKCKDKLFELQQELSGITFSDLCHTHHEELCN